MGHSSHVVVAAAVVAVVGPVIFGVADVSDAAAVFFLLLSLLLVVVLLLLISSLILFHYAPMPNSSRCISSHDSISLPNPGSVSSRPICDAPIIVSSLIMPPS